jgi:hypothetical protein
LTRTRGNVETRDKLGEILDAPSEVAAELPILFAFHPSTRQRVEDLRLQRFFSCAARARRRCPPPPSPARLNSSIAPSPRASITEIGLMRAIALPTSAVLGNE